MSRKRITTVYVDEELLEELKLRGLKVSEVFNNLMWMALFGVEKKPSSSEKDVELILMSMRTFANPYIKEKAYPDYMRRDSTVGLDLFIETQFTVPKYLQRLIQLYKDPGAPFHNDEEFKSWCKDQWEKMMAE